MMRSSFDWSLGKPNPSSIATSTIAAKIAVRASMSVRLALQVASVALLLAVTVENKTFITLEDIKSIQLRCKKCGTTLGRSVAEASRALHECPSCHADWLQPGTSEERRISNLATIIDTAKQALVGRHFELLLEIEPLTVKSEPKSTDSAPK
jgi:Zn finger protein HypA/HybF involved in hydrogenase expression